jgi:menaquinone-9 beta-reductase
MDADLVVIGGGPVGSTLGLLLARGGRRVAVLEKARLPRDKACGEGLLPSGARVLAGAGIDLAAEGFPPVAGVRYRLEGGASVRGDLRSGLGRGVRRTRFDALVAERASAAPGVQFLCGCAALGVHAEAHGMRVETSHGPLQAGAVVAADGLRSGTARWLGWARAPAGRARHALVGHLATDGPALGDEVVVTLLDDVEVYAAPAAPGEVLVAVLGARGTLRGAGSSVSESYRAVVRRAHPDLAGAALTGRVRGAGPFRVRPQTVAAGRVFLAGDAAGFLDPLTGDGISAGLAQAATLAALLAPLDLADGRQVAGAAARYRAWHARQWRRRWLVTSLALALSGSTALARRAMAGVGRRPQALQALLEVNDGTRGLRAVSPRDWAALAGF